MKTRKWPFTSVASAALAITLAGCVSGLGRVRPDSFNDARQHSIFIDGDGRPLQPDTTGSAKVLGISAGDDSVYGEWIHGVLTGLRSSGRHDVLLRVHGGLTALRLVAGDTGLTAQIMRESPYYPIYINWESSISSSYLDELLYIRDGRAYRGWDARGVWLSPLYLAADAGRAISRAPVTWTVQGREFITGLHSTDGLVSARAKHEQAALFGEQAVADACGSGEPLTSTEPFRVEFGRDCRSRWERAFATGLALATTIGVLPYSRDFGRVGHSSVGRMSIKLPTHLFWPAAKLFSPWASRHIAWLPLRPISSLLIDMVGGPAYANMSRRTQTMFRPALDVAAASANPLAYRPAAGALAQFLDSLQALAAPTSDSARASHCAWSAGPATVTRNEGSPYRVTIVGASLGTNVAAEIVRACPGLAFRDIIFLGAAATQRDVDEAILPYLHSDTAARFFNLTLNPAAERDEWPAGLFFSTQGSLLEWLDGLMSSPRTDEDRVFGKYENAISAIHVIPDDVRSRVIFKSFGYRNRFGNDGLPYRHADLAARPYWKCDFWMPAAFVSECRNGKP
jgi:hypothetical protein